MRSSDQTLVNAYKEISNMADHINLSRTVVDRANCLFKNVYDCKNLKGHSTDASASACLYIACRCVILNYFGTVPMKFCILFIYFSLVSKGKKVSNGLSRNFSPSSR